MLSLRLAALMALAAALLLALGPRVAKADVRLVEPFEIGDWKGGVYAQADGTRICAVTKEYENGTFLSFLITQYTLNLMINNTDWRMPVGESYQFIVRVDRSWQRLVMGHVTNEITLVTALDRDAEVLKKLKTGRSLVVASLHHNFVFELSGTFEALRLLERCYQRLAYAEISRRSGDTSGGAAATDSFGQGRGQALKPPFARERSERAPSFDNWDRLGFRAPPEQLELAFSALSGLRTVHIYPPSVDAEGIDLSIGGIPGTYIEIPTDSPEPDAAGLFRQYAEDVDHTCQSDFNSGLVLEDEAGRESFVRGFFSCSEPGFYMELIVRREVDRISFLTLSLPKDLQSEVQVVSGDFYRSLVIGTLNEEPEPGE